MLEVLESRRLMSVSFDVPSQTITIVGEKDFDEISASVSNGLLKILDNGASFNVTSSAVKRIVIDTGDGDDTVTLDDSVTQRAIVYTGEVNFGIGEQIKTGSGKDTIYVESPFAAVDAGPNDDYIYNYQGLSVLTGGSGNDHLVNATGGSTDSKYEGGSGYDVVDFSNFVEGIVLRNGDSGPYIENTGNPPTLNGAKGTDAVSEMEAFYGGSGNDFIYGDGNANLIKGNGGDDYLYGGGGNDTLYGNAGSDHIYGEGGNDQIFAKDGTKDFLFGGSGTDSAQKDAIDVVNSVEGTIA